jgi:putative transposase
MPTKKNAIYRTDLLSHGMNAGKESKVFQLLRAWRSVAVSQAGEQWKLVFTKGHTNKRHNVSRTGYDVVGTSYGQMVRWQVVGQIESWLSNRANEFKDIVNRSSLDAGMKHQLHFINRWQAWYDPAPLTMKDGSLIGDDARRMARLVMRHLLKIHRKPDLSKASMLIDQRCISLAEGSMAVGFPLWARLSTLDKGQRIDIPLVTHAHFERRKGAKAMSLQISLKDSELRFGVMTDVSAAFDESKAAYKPRTEAIGLDLGLKTLFATDQGELLGQQWLTKLQVYDRKITALAKHRQRTGLKPRSEKYKRYVASLKGFIRSEIGRIINRLVEVRAPAEIVVERLNFNNPNLSRRLNRILKNFGQGEVERKLADLHERLGIEITKVNPAYSSQQDSGCGYTDKRNRPKQEAFSCHWCGSKRHADVNAARNLLHRRSDATGDCKRPKGAILDELVSRFLQRFNRPKGGATDPRMRNPYFKAWASQVT